ncbi:MAG: sulfate reduction electron transfer complex DsrMKJOP subunit DsrJ [Acidobacteriota bacterium]
MKIYNADKIIPGLVIFLILVTLPLWYNHGKAAPAPQPKISDIAQAKKQCVLSKDEMRTGHMQLLNEWRTEVVRNGKRTYVAPDGKEYVMSLQNECMKCHNNKEEFCDKCHTYAGLKTDSTPYCWTCHIAPKEKKDGK